LILHGHQENGFEKSRNADIESDATSENSSARPKVATFAGADMVVKILR
jgi:hypothetical protein